VQLLAAAREEADDLVLAELAASSSGSASRGENGTGRLGAGEPASSRREPVASDERERLRSARAASSHAESRNSGRRAARARARARASVAVASRSISGHGASGLTWSIVTGETPPQSSIPASSRRGKSS
jgi:hypothetical protein